ncbi:hypothetical protein HHI36_016730, partial [Cryptolaemus montrouzieri]
MKPWTGVMKRMEKKSRPKTVIAEWLFLIVHLVINKAMNNNCRGTVINEATTRKTLVKNDQVEEWNAKYDEPPANRSAPIRRTKENARWKVAEDYSCLFVSSFVADTEPENIFTANI